MARTYRMRMPGWVACAALVLAGCASWHDVARLRQQEVARKLESVRHQPEALRGFLREMPKGGDLHKHLVGAISTESLIRWGAEDGICVDTTIFSTAAPPCPPGAVPLSEATPGSRLYEGVLKAWSLHGAGDDFLDRHQHFFGTFRRFNAVTRDERTPDMLVEVMTVAHAHRQIYLELMMGLGAGRAGQLASKHMQPGDTWDEVYLLARRSAIAADPDFEAAVRESASKLSGWHAQARRRLRCDTPRADPACGVELRFLVQASRTQPREYVFGQFVFAFELAQRSPLVVGVNMVQPEEHATSLLHYEDQMRALGVLHQFNRSDPRRVPVRITLHAGELVARVLPDTPEGRRHLTFHIRRAVEVGRAERIGHGVDVLSETEGAGVEALLEALRERNVLVEICLTSNERILGVSGDAHPLSPYLRHGVPVALATDDEGVLRSSITHEYVLAVQVHGLDYPTLKAMVRASLEHSFLPGASLWKPGTRYAPVEACGQAEPGSGAPAPACQRLLGSSERAALQWRLESQLREFELSVLRR